MFNFHYSFIEKNRSRKIIMDPDNFFEQVVLSHLDEYVSVEFETICKDFLKRKHVSSIQEIGRFWHNDASKRQDVEIDIVMRANEQIYLYECKWTNTRIGMSIIKNFEHKSNYFTGALLGFFSKTGYNSDLIDKGYDLYEIDDLYNFD